MAMPQGSSPSEDHPQPNLPEEENELVDKEIVELHQIYDKEMKDYSPGKRHSTVVVLLLYWDKVSKSYLDTKEEVDQLHEIFQTNFRYTVYKKSLNANRRKSPINHLLAYITDAVYQVDEPNSLLIIYYAGHGNPDENGDIILSGGNNDADSKVETIIWREAEKLVRNAKQSDVFLIFDCCYAGRVPTPVVTRQAFSSKTFEYMAASVKTTKGPGKDSFTSALIYALEKLSKDPDGFTTQLLYSTIRSAPNFPKKQTPVLEERPGSYSPRKLQLAPLPQAGDAPPPMTPIDTEEDKNNAKFGLYLQLTFDRLPARSEMVEMCKGMKAMVQDKQLHATQINWKGMHRSNESMYDMPPSVYFTGKKWFSMTRRVPKTSIGSKEMMHAGRSRRLSELSNMPDLAHCESPTDVRETINTHSMEKVGEAAGEKVIDRLKERELLVPKSGYYYRPDLTKWKVECFVAGTAVGVGCVFCALVCSRKVGIVLL